MAAQLWVDRNSNPADLSEAGFNPVRPRRENAWPSAKPSGGLWTSTYDERYGSGWIQWCLGEEFGCDRSDPTWQRCWLLEPRADARVYVIDKYDDLATLCATHGATRRHHGATYELEQTYPDWARVTEDFDAVRLTDAGQWATRLSHPLNLYGWDCESTLWFRWAFEAVEPIGARTFQAAPDAWWDEQVALTVGSGLRTHAMRSEVA